jgi:uncharacterized protein YdeI (YjbR/CyaY-like superfamily)
MPEKPTWDKVKAWKTELQILTSIIEKTEMVKSIKWGAPVYTFNGKNIIGINGFKNFFTIWFFNGVLLKDDLKVLINAQEGVTKNLRQWRFTSKDEIVEKEILAYIYEAMKL